MGLEKRKARGEGKSDKLIFFSEGGHYVLGGMP